VHPPSFLMGRRAGACVEAPTLSPAAPRRHLYHQRNPCESSIKTINVKQALASAMSSHYLLHLAHCWRS
jgi:hypothetical protein